MAAARRDLIIEQGVSFTKRMKLTNSSGVGINLTGETIRGQIRAYPSSPTVLATFTCTLADQTSNPGEFDISLTAAETSSLPGKTNSKNPAGELNELCYDIERVRVDSKIMRLLNGLAIVSPEVTRT